MEYFIITLALLFLGAIFSIFVKEDLKMRFCSIFAFLATIFSSILATKVLFFNEIIKGELALSSIFGEIDFVVDHLSALFLLLITIMGFITSIYANGYIKPYLNKGMNISSHCVFFMLLIASMLMVVTIQNSLFFLIAWEIMSLSSFFLVIFENEKKGVLKSGIKYLVYMHLSVIFLMTMFAILFNYTGSFDFKDYINLLNYKPQIANLAFILGFIGFGFKAGFVPFHNWLPDAHPAAPTHVSALMSGVMIKTGIYGILRLILVLGISSKGLGYLVLSVGIITLLYGILYAITQKDLKKLLAYSSIENIGIIALGISIGMLGIAYQNHWMTLLGFCGAVLHIVNHSIFKELMFFAAGSVYLKTHTRNMEELGGLIKNLPKTGFLFLLGSVAICGLPPFNGFISELLIYAGILLGVPASEINLFIVLIISVAALALVGTMAVLCFSKAAGTTFLGEARTEKAKFIEMDSPCSMILPMRFLLTIAFIIGITPQVILPMIFSAISMFTNNEIFIQYKQLIIEFLQNYSIIILAFIGFIILIGIIRYLINHNAKIYSTWGCGYNKINSQMQYTASSYVNLFISTLKPLFKRVSHVKKPKELFPKDAYFESKFEDIEEAYLVEPIIKWDEKILTKFERIQNGNIQQYILFGLIFLIITIIGAICK